MKCKIKSISAKQFIGYFLILSNTLIAQNGSLDLSFGNNGKVNTTLGSGDSECNAVIIQSDGKIVMAGFSFNGSNHDFALARFNSNGSFDETFGTNGKLTTNFGTNTNDRAISLAIQLDGKIVAAGFSANGTNQDIALARYNTDGSLDLNFGNNGKVTTAIDISSDVAYSVAIQSDGKIVAAGYSFRAFNDDFALLRYHTNGTLDNTFGNNGIVTTDVGNIKNDVIRSIAIQNDGKIVALGSSANATNTDFALARYNVNGNLDNTFGTNGIIITPFGSGNDDGYSVGIQSDGKIVAAGRSHNESDYDFALARYNTNGSLDNSFDLDGKVTSNIEFGNDVAYSIGVQSDGKILAAGYGYVNFNNDFVIIRYNSNGSLDNTFGTNGVVTTPIFASDIGTSLKIQNDGKIILAGFSHNGVNNEFVVVRYNNSISLGTSAFKENSEIKIFPNPFSTKTSLLSKNYLQNATLCYYNLLGEKVKQMNNISGKEVTLFRDNLSNGLYFIKLTQHEKDIVVKKVIIID